MRFPVKPVTFALIFFIFLELFFHLYHRYYRGFWSFFGSEANKVTFSQPVDDRRKFSLKRNFKDTMYTIDEDGFRVNHYSKANNNNLTKNICIIGDSVPFGYGVSNKETYPYFLQQFYSSENIRVINGGVPSYNFRQSIDRWEIDIKPNVNCNVIIINAANDISLIHKTKENYNADITWFHRRLAGYVQKKYFSTPIYFERLVEILLSKFNKSQEQKKWVINSKEYKDLIKKNIQVFKDSFSKEIKKIVVNSNIPTIIIPINLCFYYNLPLNKSADSCKNYENYSRLSNVWRSSVIEVNEFLLSQSANKNIFFLDMVKYFENTVGKEDKYIDFGHLSKLGAKIYATKIKKFLKEEDLIKY